MKEQKGITLVALVITIIVLLILAGVSIAALGGQNGILTKSAEAKELDELGAAKDQVALAANKGIQDYYEATYVTDNAGTANPKTPTAYVCEAIDLLGMSIGNVVSTQTGAFTGEGNARTGAKLKLTSSDGKKEVVCTIDANGALTWGNFQPAGTDRTTF